MSRLKDMYKNEIVDAMIKKFGYKNKGISKSVHGGAVWYDMILEFKDE